MPNYDLGRATGEVVIKTDTKGINQSDKALSSFEKTVQSLQVVIDRFDRVLDRLEGQLDDVAAAAHKADRALDDLDGSFASVHKSSGHASDSVGDFNSELGDTIRSMQKAVSIAKPLWKAYDHIKSSMEGFNDAQGIGDYVRALNRATLFTAGLRRATGLMGDRIIGVSRAYRELNERQSRFVNMAGKVSAVAAGFAVFNRLGPRIAGFVSGLGSAQRAGTKFAQVFQKVIDVATTGEGRMAKYAQSIAKVAFASDSAGKSIGRFYRSSNNMTNSLDKIARGGVGVVIGLKVARQAVDSLRQRFSLLGNNKVRMGIAAIAGAFSLLGPAAEIGAKALTIVSNAANLLWNAGKQLAGGLLAVPGIFATIVGAALPVMIAFKRLGTQFEDVFKAKTPEELAEALKALPEELRPLGQRLFDIKKSLEEIGDVAVKSFLGKDAIKEIDTLEAALKGPIIKNFALVNNAARQFRQQLINTVSAGENITGLNQVFQSSRQFIDNMRAALDPFVSGMRDLVVVGSQFFADWTGGADRLATSFAKWTAQTREAGKLRAYMDDALQGAKDLVRGTLDLGKALGTLLTLFATDTGDNALERYAKSMEKFNNWANKSKAEGVLKKIADAVKNMGTERLDKLIATFKELYAPIESLFKVLAPMASAFSQAFSDKLVTAIKVAAKILEEFFGAFSGLESIIGHILGFVAAGKLIGLVVAPMLLAGKAAIGMAIAFKGLQSIFYSGAILSFVGMLDRILPGTQKASNGLEAMATKAEKAKSKLAAIGKVMGGFAAAAAVLYLGITAAGDQIKDFNNTLEEGKKANEEYKESLRSAFLSDNGLVGKSVFDTVTTQMTDMRAQLEKEASQVPDWIDNLQETWFGTGKGMGQGQGIFSWAQGDEFNALQKGAQDAERAKKKFDELGLSSQDLAAVVTGSESSFASFAQTIRESGENGNEAAASLEKQRAMYQAIQQDFATTSEGSTTLVNAITAIGDAGDDTASKLSALNAALKALGFNKADEYEAAFAFSEAIRKLGEEAANAVDASQPLEGIFGPNGVLATSGPAAVNAENLYNVLKQGVDAFKEQAVASGDVEGAWNTLQETLPKTADAFKVSLADIQGVVTNLTGNEYTVSLLLAVEGEDAVKAQIAAILLQYQKGGEGQEIKIPLTPNVDRTQLQAALDAAFGTGKAAVGEQTLTIAGANITPEALAELQSAIPGLKLPGAPAPKPAEIATAPVPAPPKPGAPTPGPAPISGATQQAEPPKIAPPPADTAALDAANAKVKALEATIKALNEQKTRIEIDTTKLDEVKPKLDEIKAVVDAFGAQNVEFTIVAKGYDETVAVVNRVKESVTQLLGVVNQIPAKFQAAFAAAIAAANSFVAQFQAVMSSLAATASAQGSAFVDALAAGISSNGAAVAAAERMAGEIRARFHQSPPKKGPLAAHGDAAKYAGGAFVDAYATGMNGNRSGTASANQFAGGLAGAAQGPYDLGKLIGAFSDIVGLGAKFAEIFGQVSDAIFNTMKFIADPLGKGTFFGQSPGAAFGFKRDPSVSDADLAQARAEKLQAEVQNPTKAQTPEEKAQADQAKADAEKQNEITSKLLDEVVGGLRVAPPTEEEQAADKKTETDRKKDAKAEAKAAGTVKTPEIKAKTDAEFNKTATEAAAALSSKLDSLSPADRGLIESGDVSIKTQDQMLAELVKQTPLLQTAIDVSKADNAGTEESVSALQTVQSLIDSQGEANTPAAKQQKQALESLSSTIQSNAGLTTGTNPIDQAAGIAGSAANVAKDVFASIDSVLQSIGAAKDIGDTLVRGFENSEDVMKTIDNVQQFITTAAQIAQAVSSGLGVAAGLAAAGGADPTGGGAAAAGALAGASQIASLVSAGLSTVNGVIDLAQEVYRIGGKYFGQFLGFLTGGVGGQLMGDVRFLLDQTDGSLKTWSRDNPEDKRTFDNPFQQGGIQERGDRIGEINVYGGPGQDPRDMTNEMMYAVTAASSGAGFQN